MELPVLNLAFAFVELYEHHQMMSNTAQAAFSAGSFKSIGAKIVIDLNEKSIAIVGFSRSKLKVLATNRNALSKLLPSINLILGTGDLS